ncbi:DUF748 domain-containing protein [Variovorax sp. OV329]|uniref:DUF748 domain-containing protein n=1 Tax=Variovorax sp. OV329 TaxID=1882825 RepID=UPI0008E7A4E2|nr:DUF748 domain-containing protein [Variovorax sp. OV329]SFN15790.1 Uncharacterized protein involved in outer membrane biogenesis [Variovorax sp. OV329]
MNAVTLRNNKWVRRAVIALAVLLALWAIAWAAVPPILKSQVQKIASEKLGRQVTIGKVDFKPWTLELAVDDLRIASADGTHSQVDVGRIYVDAELQSILRLAPVIDAVTVERPRLKVVRNKDGSYDFDDIVKRLASQPEKPKGDPARFAIYNIQLTGGEIDLDDQAIGPKHEVRDITLGVPFLSSFASQRDVKVEPKLAFKLNGSTFDSDAQATPFAEMRAADGRLQIHELDLAPFLPYAPRDQIAKVSGGKLSADLKVDFKQGTQEGLSLSGTVELKSIGVVDARNKDLLGFESLKVVMADVRPLQGMVHLSEVALQAPKVAITRNAQGRLNIQPVDPAESAGKPAEMSRPAVEAAKGAAEKLAWKVQVDKVGLQAGQAVWRDETLSPAAALELGQLQMEAQNVFWPMDKPATFSGSTQLGGGGIQFKGEGTAKAAKVQAELKQLPISLGGAYLAQQLVPTVDGKVSGQAEISWNQPDLNVHVKQFSIDGLALAQGKTSLASVGRVELGDARVDLAKRTVEVANLSLSKPQFKVERGSDKTWMYEGWRKTPAAPAANGGAAASAKAAEGNGGAQGKPWQVSLGNLSIDGGVVGFVDKANEKTPVEVEVNNFSLKMQQLALDGAKPSPIEVSGRISSGRRADPGRFSYKGKVALKPVLATDGKVDLNALPVHAFKAYFADQAPNVDLRRFYLNYRGDVRYTADPAGPKVSLAGDTALEDVRVNSALLAPGGAGARADERGASRLLSWKSLSLRGVKFDMVPKSPFSLDVRETTLTDLFARLVIDESGTLHLQDLASRQPIDIGKPVAANAQGQPAAEGAAQPPQTRKRLFGRGTVTQSNQPVTPKQGPAPPAEAMVGSEQSAAAPQAAAPAAPAPADTGPKPTINFGPISLVNARIDFNDRFVKPNYSADLSELTGKLSAFSSKPVDGKTQLADLELRGKAQQTAALEIVGKLNPLAKPLELDITAKMRDLELAPLSPYAGRYVGYGIERGKMSVDLNYKITPDGRLTATNKLVLNQLTFSDQQAPGAERTLPVRFAMALLADRNGVVDIDLPVSGSINDPQFSVWPIIWKGIVNLIVKAVTSPVALFTGGGGGSGGESNTIAFDAGRSELNTSAKESLDKVAKALAERPTLRMTVIGTADLEKEKSAYERQRLRELAQAEKRRAAVRAGKDAGEVSPVTDAEYPDLITEVYKRADFSKPRNMVGLQKGLPLKEMEDLLISNMTVNDESIRQLAVQRGVVVRDYLLEQKLPAERLFLGAVQTKASGADWKPGAELKLDAR